MGNLNAASIRSITAAQSLPVRMRALSNARVARAQLPQLLAASEKGGGSSLSLTSRAVLTRSMQGDQEEAADLVKWSIKRSPASRRAVVKSFIQARQPGLYVHQLARLKRSEAGTGMKDFFTEGGSMRDVADWMSAAGEVLRTGRIPSDTDGLWGWIADTAGTVVDAVTGAINTVADAVKTAGKNLADAVSSVVKWSQSKIDDFVEAVLAAGKRVSELLTQAAKKGLSAINKFVTAILEAGKKALDVMKWAVDQTKSVMESVARKLLSLMGSLTSFIQEMAKLAVESMRIMVRTLLAIGKTVSSFVVRLGRITAAAAREIVREILRATNDLRGLVRIALGKARDLIARVIDGIFAAGKKLVDIMREVAGLASSAINRFIGALKDIGQSLVEILKAVGAQVQSLAIQLVRGVRSIWRNVATVLTAIARQTAQVLQTLLTALIGTGLHLLSVIRSIMQRVRSAFRRGLIQGLLEIGNSLLTLLKEAVKISASVVTMLFGIALGILGKYRKLTSIERAEAQKIFGASINLDLVRLTDASLPADLIMWINGNRPFTTMYHIHYKSGTRLTNDVLIHELTHVWQGVTSGSVYMVEALCSQASGAGYRLTEADVKKAKGKLLNLEREQQAVVVEEYYKGKFQGISDSRLKVPVAKLEPLAKQVYKARAGLRSDLLRGFTFDAPTFFGRVTSRAHRVRQG